jgi:hypothetical protein
MHIICIALDNQCFLLFFNFYSLNLCKDFCGYLSTFEGRLWTFMDRMVQC